MKWFSRKINNIKILGFKGVLITLKPLEILFPSFFVLASFNYQLNQKDISVNNYKLSQSDKFEDLRNKSEKISMSEKTLSNDLEDF